MTLRLFCSPALFACLAGISLAQAAKPAPAATSASSATSAEHGLQLVQSGRCQEALPILKQSTPHLADKDLKLKAGLAIVRCAMTLNQPATATSALEMLNRDFPRDPEVLYISVHAFSDLSTQAAQQLAQAAPNSHQAHELNAEALEIQGKWDDAAREYETILKQDPDLPGIHYRLGRLLLSRPNPAPDATERARKELEAELKIDPSNAGAEYVLGELARQEQQWDAAAQHFSRAAKLDSGFGGAYLGWGEALINTKKYSEAIQPLEMAAKLEPANPATHYNLATAYSRSGRKADADREFAVHRRLTQKVSTDQTQPQSPNP